MSVIVTSMLLNGWTRSASPWVTTFGRSFPVGLTIKSPPAGEDSPFRAGAMAARHPQMLVLDCLYVGVVQRTHEATDLLLTSATEAIDRHRLPQR
ncbi:hypothetical protein ACXJJ3_00675 [Kribbella sp. WER1]